MLVFVPVFVLSLLVFVCNNVVELVMLMLVLFLFTVFRMWLFVWELLMVL